MKEANTWLDRISYGIFHMNHYVGEELESKKSIAYYALFQACLTKRPFNLFHRNNLSIRTADVKRNFGNKNTWEKNFEVIFKSFLIEINSKIFKSAKTCYSANESVLEINTNYDLVYIDPPYLNKDGKNETADYHKCYHFLEGIVNYDQWLHLIDYQSKTLRLKHRPELNPFTKERYSTLLRK